MQEAIDDLKSRVAEWGNTREEENDGVVVKGAGVREWKGMEVKQV